MVSSNFAMRYMLLFHSGLAAINQHNNNTGIVAIVCSRAVGEIKVLLKVTGNNFIHKVIYYSMLPNEM